MGVTKSSDQSNWGVLYYRYFCMEAKKTRLELLVVCMGQERSKHCPNQRGACVLFPGVLDREVPLYFIMENDFLDIESG